MISHAGSHSGCAGVMEERRNEEGKRGEGKWGWATEQGKENGRKQKRGRDRAARVEKGKKENEEKGGKERGMWGGLLRGV
jgi:hypothetical protein